MPASDVCSMVRIRKPSAALEDYCGGMRNCFTATHPRWSAGYGDEQVARGVRPGSGWARTAVVIGCWRTNTRAATRSRLLYARAS